MDLADHDCAERIVSAALASWPRVDVLINNAAIQGPIGPLVRNDWAAWVTTLQVNLITPTALCRQVVPWMTTQGSGSIINISGGGATAARPNYSAYATAKAGLVRLSETLAEELRPHGVRVNCVAPGAMATDMLGATAESGPDVAGAKEYEVATRVLRDGETAMRRATSLCLFLASPASSGVTGKLISAVWDPWEHLQEHRADLDGSDIYTLRRIVPKDRGKDWGDR
jgi:3-oxoacyl-[acyl-carrier protein] reductase